jgi:predicted transcriptional regulator
MPGYRTHVKLEIYVIVILMYSANLNHRAADKYLNELHEKGLIEIVDRSLRKKFQTTPRGKQVLDRLEEALQLLQHGEAIPR